MKVDIEDTKWPETLFPDGREDGLHLGSLIRSLSNRTGLSYKGAGFSDMELTAEIGLLWEDVLSKVMAEKYAIRPPNMLMDGIWVSPDGVNTDPKGEVPLVVEEYKATWKSTRNPPTEHFQYMVQVKAYCRALGTNVAIMRLFHLMGDYKGSGPIYRVARIVFTDREIEENWAMVLRERDRWIEEKR